MNRKLATIFTVGVATILIGSLVYAADRKKQAKQFKHTLLEEEALKTELLEAVEDEKKQPAHVDAGNVTGSKSTDKNVHAKTKKEKTELPL